MMGGTFDPPHHAHLLLARDVVEAVGLERLYFVPAAQNPHKAAQPVASGAHRLAMLEAAVAPEARLGVLDLEIRRGGTRSYTVETVRALRDRFPGRDLAWVIGADQLPGLPRWHAIGELIEAVEFLVLARPGHALQPPAIRGLRWRAVSSRQLEISSSEVRSRIIDGKPIDFLAPEAVLKYIRKHRLYIRQWPDTSAR